MSDTRTKSGSEDKQANPSEGRKKAYNKPSYRSEQIFETIALACGKTPGSHQAHCRGFSVKRS